MMKEITEEQFAALRARVQDIYEDHKNPNKLIEGTLGCNEWMAKKISKAIRRGTEAKGGCPPEVTTVKALKALYDHLLPITQAFDQGIANAAKTAVEQAAIKANVNTEQTDDIPQGVEEVWRDKYSAGNNYHFDAVSNTYTFFLPEVGKMIPVSKEQLEGMRLAYSKHGTGKAESVNEICRRFTIPRDYFLEIKKILGWTVEDLPLTEEQKKDKTADQLNKILDAQSFERFKHIRVKEDYKKVERDANLWRQYQIDKLLPMEEFHKTFNPQPIPPMERHILNNVSVVKNQLIIVLSDLHFGARSLSKELFSGYDFNSEVAAAFCEDYAAQIIKKASDFNYRFEKILILLLGDTLHATPDGTTVKGVELECEMTGKALHEYAFNQLNRFITRMFEHFKTLEIHSVDGNHAGIFEWFLAKNMMNYWRSEKDITWHIHESQRALFSVGSCSILMDHGASSAIKNQTPSDAKGRFNLISGFYHEKPEYLQAKQCLYIQGDKHHYEQQELGTFTFLMASSWVPGDDYGDTIGKYSRSQQNCFVLGEDGLEEDIHIYFDAGKVLERINKNKTI